MIRGFLFGLVSYYDPEHSSKFHGWKHQACKFVTYVSLSLVSIDIGFYAQKPSNDIGEAELGMIFQIQIPTTSLEKL